MVKSFGEHRVSGRYEYENENTFLNFIFEYIK